MLTTANPIDVATQAANENIFSEKLQLTEGSVQLELKPNGTDAETKAILKVSNSGSNPAIPHEDAEVLIPAGNAPVVVPFEGLKKGTFAEVHFDKQTATAGTLTASLV